MIKSVIFVFILFCWGSCVCPDAEETISSAGRLAAVDPDSAWNLLSRLKVNTLEPAVKGRYALLYTELQYRRHVPMSSDSLLAEAWRYYTEENDEENLARVYYYRGKIYSDSDSVEEAVRCLVNAEQYALKSNCPGLLGAVYNELGKLHSGQYIITEALDHYRKARFCFRLAGEEANENYAVGNMAKCFLHLNRQDSAWSYCVEAIEKAERRGDDSYRTHLEEYFAYFYLCKDEMPPIEAMQDSVKRARLLAYTFQADTLSAAGGGETYSCFLQYRMHQDSLNPLYGRNYIFQVEDKYRNEHLRSQNYLLEINNYRKTITVIILVSLLIVLALSALLVILHHRKVVKEKIRAIDEFTGLVEALKEENKVSEHNLLARLNEKDRKEAELKAALNKRLGIIRQLTDLSFKYGEGHKSRDIFCRKVKELMSVDTLTQDVLADLLEIADLNYGGIISFLKERYKLSTEELELCSFICSGFTPQEMSVLYNVNVNNIYVRCSRLGKKMGLQVPLTSYLREMVQYREEKEGEQTA